MTMVKIQKRTMEVITILFMLAASPLSVTYSFADMEYNHVGMEEQTIANDIQKERLGVILTEKMIDGKLQVQRYALPDDATEEDMQRMLPSEAQTSGWAYVDYNAYHSGIILFDGKASKVGENLWKISSYDVLNLGEIQSVLESSKKSNDSHMMPDDSDKDLIYKVVFSGKISESFEESVLAIAFMISSIKTLETSQNMKFLQIGGLYTNSEKSVDSNLELNSFG